MSKVVAVPPRNSNQIRAFARRIIAYYQPNVFRDEPFDIDKFFTVTIPKITDITTGITDIHEYGEGLLGVTVAAAKESLVDASLYESDDTVIRRRCRATMGHESGHCLMHVDFAEFLSKLQAGALFFRNESDIPPWEHPEWQSWEFARQLLMPEEVFRRCLGEGYSHSDLVERFDVNPSFVRSWADALRKRDKRK